MKNIWRIITFSKTLWPYYAAISVFTILLSLMALMQPLLTGWAIDEIQKGSSASVKYLVLLAVGIFVLDFFGTIFSNIGGYIGDQMAARLRAILSVRYYEHLLSLPQRYFDTELSGKVINRLSRSITQITNFMQMMSNNFLQFIFTTVFSLIAVAIYSWQVALMLFALYPIYIWMTFRSSDTWQKYQAEINTEGDIATGRFAESIGQVKVVKSFVQEARELAFFNKRVKKVIDVTKPQSKYWHSKDVQRRVILNLIFLGVYLYIFIAAANGQFSAGQAVALILYALQIRIPIFTISFLVDNTQRAIADSRDYFEVMSLVPAINDATDRKKLQAPNGRIDFKNVSFAYDEKQVIKNVSFTAAPDQKLALVGESGEGKTTLTNLLIRLYEPQSGVIEIDGQDISSVTQKSLRESIGVVFQDPALFSGTIYENIAYANPKASEKAVIAAAKAANAHEFISKFDKKYQTEIGERGLKLSGGQKQRIAIARALLKDAPILILDEATSSLDSKSEMLVQQALERLMKGRTTIIIAHRLTTIAHVDMIVTLKNGRIHEMGAPNELAQTSGIYAQLLAVGKDQGERAKKRLKAFELR
jgi:ATP-binding cassette, subfamily B, bacterial